MTRPWSLELAVDRGIYRADLRHHRYGYLRANPAWRDLPAEANRRNKRQLHGLARALRDGTTRTFTNADASPPPTGRALAPPHRGIFAARVAAEAVLKLATIAAGRSDHLHVGAAGASLDHGHPGRDQRLWPVVVLGRSLDLGSMLDHSRDPPWSRRQ